MKANNQHIYKNRAVQLNLSFEWTRGKTILLFISLVIFFFQEILIWISFVRPRLFVKNSLTADKAISASSNVISIELLFDQDFEAFFLILWKNRNMLSKKFDHFFEIMVIWNWFFTNDERNRSQDQNISQVHFVSLSQMLHQIKIKKVKCSFVSSISVESSVISINFLSSLTSECSYDLLPKRLS